MNFPVTLPILASYLNTILPVLVSFPTVPYTVGYSWGCACGYGRVGIGKISACGVISD